MSQSTSLESLTSSDGGGPPADEERVRRILAEMNADAVVQQPPPSGGSALPRVITEPPVSMSTGELRMDTQAARANVIGNSTPTMADFHAMFQQTSPGMAPFMGNQPDPGAVVPKPANSVSWKAMIMSQLKSPIAVAIIIFFLNMPVVTSIMSRYASWMYLGSGEISIGGLIVKALLAAFLFAIYQAVA
jgi:hypothetical protein